MPFGLHGSCTNCGCSVHECECPERDFADTEFMKKLERFFPASNAERSYLCFDCLAPADSYMVTDHVWDTAWPFHRQHRRVMKKRAAELGLDPKRVVKQLLCFICLEKRLRRRLVIDDFTSVVSNHGIRLGYRMGSEPPTRG